MRKWTTAFLAVLALGGGTLMAATLSNANGQSCGEATGTWHFVNNQTGGTSTVGTITATFSSGPGTCTNVAVLQNTQHFICEASGTLISASTDLPGKLVLSDFSCGDIKEPPPPCDPKTEKCE